MNMHCRLKLKVDFEFQIAITWNALKRFMWLAYDVAECVLF